MGHRQYLPLTMQMEAAGRVIGRTKALASRSPIKRSQLLQQPWTCSHGAPSNSQTSLAS